MRDEFRKLHAVPPCLWRAQQTGVSDGESIVTFDEILAQVLDVLQRDRPTVCSLD